MPGPQRNAYAKPKNAKHTFLRLMRYLRKYSGLLAIIIPSLIISSAASVLGTYLLKPLFNQIAALFEQGGSSMLPVLGTVLALAAIYVLGALGTFVGNRLLINVATGILKTVRCEMFERLQALPLKYFDTRTHGEIMSRFTNDTDAMREMLGQGLPQLIVSTISVIGVLTMMFVLTPLLTLIVLVDVRADAVHREVHRQALGPFLLPPAGRAGRRQRLCGGDDRGAARGQGVLP